MTEILSTLAERFESLELDPKTFSHADHIHVAYDMLDHYDFIDASYRYARSIEQMAARAGVPGKFNATITLAFMGIIAERKARNCYASSEDFLGKNEDLLERQILEKWYSPARLGSTLARKQFLLPDRVDHAENS